MREFRVSLPNRPGELARLAEIFSAKEINLKSVAVVAEGNRAIACLVADDVTAAREALQDARVPFAEAELLTELVENEPGVVAGLATKLTGAGVNVESLYVLARDSELTELGFTVDDPKKAKKALGH
ncbi:MAG TPA: hypothetical protein VFI25_14500 [Planctomycetota bacterium]|jgi:hypothetical protein|nr:hypothetical protein [Planctomycetota bacterium]